MNIMEKEKKEKLTRKNYVSLDDVEVFEEEVEMLDEDNPLPKKKSPLKLAKHKKKKRKLKKWVYIIVLLSLILIGAFVYYYIHKENEEKAKLEISEKIKEIESHYNDIVIVNNKTNLYEKNNDNYEVIGSIYKDNVLELSSIKIDQNTKYFNIKDSDYYIEYESVSKTDKKEEYSNRYKKYLPFNKNVVTKDGFVLYDNDKEIISFNKSMEFPIIINNYENRYYVEYNNRLLSIKKDDVKEIIDKKNTDKKNISSVTTFAYHRVYSSEEKCTDPYVCIKKDSFDKEMKYLHDNNYLTFTMEEMYMYLKGNLQAERAVTITLDDGYLYKSAEEVLKKYDLNATMFVISNHFDNIEPFKKLTHIDIQSHTHHMHRNYVCSGGNQGGAILCASKNEIISDLKTSVEKLGVEPFALAFPFYDYNENAINALKEVGFKMSFIGRGGVMGKSIPNKTNLYKIPRMTVWEESLMNFNTWKSYL